jgi:hypothetical protein
MAKKSVPASDPVQDEELVVTVVRFKGSGETARKGIDAVSQALAAAFGGGTTVMRQVNGRKAAALPAAPADSIDVDTGNDEAEEQDDEQQDEATPSITAKGPAKPRKLPKFDSKLAVTPFKAFAAERNPQTVDEKYLVACLWLQEEAQLESYGASQVFTCFRAMEWQTYDDFTQPMRQLKKNKSYYADADKRGEWKLNDHGLDEARKVKHQPNA